MDLVISLSYRGHPLDQSDSFRLVYLEPGQKNDMIYIRLENARLSDSPPYEAVSYTWGDASETATTQTSSELNGSEPTAHNVTVNCFSALQRLRRTDERRVLWIDAICINQESTAERNHQLGLTAMIYAKASAVVMYLGEGDEQCDATVDFIARIVDLGCRLVRIEPCETYGLTLSQAPWELMASFLRRPWFSRIWVLQELANAQTATVYCGSKELPWKSIIDFVRYDPRDKVFAVIPLIERERQLLDAMDPEFLTEAARNTPEDVAVPLPGMLLNYSLSPCEVFVNLALYFLKNVGLGVLRVAGLSSHLSSLPSWATDWSQSSVSRYRRFDYTGFSVGGEESSDGSLELAPPCSAISGAATLVTPTNQTRQALPGPVWDYKLSSFHELRVKAVKYGVVEKIGGLCDFDHDCFPISQWQRLVSRKCLEDTSFERLIVADLYVCPIIVKIAIDKLSEYDSNNGTESATPAQLDPPLTPLEIIKSFISVTHMVQADFILKACDKRRLFVTDGQKIGLAPENAEEGDIIFFIVGVTVPFVLRKFAVDNKVGSNYYKLIGECYLRGIGKRAWLGSRPIVII
ncbi:heterokaryon incompatibility protein-domain-containing protein [Xylaria digitata]|nr:heterokaryon incompatibility protein-domain-containing protein [Xylaria digitata]